MSAFDREAAWKAEAFKNYEGGYPEVNTAYLGDYNYDRICCHDKL